MAMNTTTKTINAINPYLSTVDTFNLSLQLLTWHKYTISVLLI